MKTSCLSVVLAFHISLFTTVIQGQVYPPLIIQEDTSDTINEEWTPERSIIELIKEKDCFSPLNIINSIDDIDYTDKYGATMLMYSSFLPRTDIPMSLNFCSSTELMSIREQATVLIPCWWHHLRVIQK